MSEHLRFVSREIITYMSSDRPHASLPSIGMRPSGYVRYEPPSPYVVAIYEPLRHTDRRDGREALAEGAGRARLAADT